MITVFAPLDIYGPSIVDCQIESPRNSVRLALRKLLTKRTAARGISFRDAILLSATRLDYKGQSMSEARRATDLKKKSRILIRVYYAAL